MVLPSSTSIELPSKVIFAALIFMSPPLIDPHSIYFADILTRAALGTKFRDDTVTLLFLPGNRLRRTNFLTSPAPHTILLGNDMMNERGADPCRAFLPMNVVFKFRTKILKSGEDRMRGRFPQPSDGSIGYHFRQ